MYSRRFSTVVLKSVLIIAVALDFSGCRTARISDAKVDEEINKRGGKIIAPPQPGTEVTVLEGPMLPFVVSNSPSFGTPSIRIDSRLLPNRCREFCWETVSREYLDGTPVPDPGTNAPQDQQQVADELNKRAVNGYHPDVITQPGKGDDGACDERKRSSRFYEDAPIVQEEDFDKGGRFRVYVLEQETCLRCLAPRSGYIGCVKWYYVRVRQNDRPTTVRLVTTGRVEPGPSAEFTAAINAWNKP